MREIFRRPLADITFISIPEHFNTSAYDAVVEAGSNENGLIQSWQIRRFFSVARLAYGLNSCQGFGLTEPGSCDIEEGPHYAMFIDYNRDYMDLLIADMTEFFFVVEGKERLGNLGAQRLDGLSGEAVDEYRDEVRHAIQAFVKRSFPEPDDSGLAFLRAVVISGEAPRPAFSNVHDAIINTLPNHKIYDSIDPLFVGAVGAAQWAKLHVLRPELLKDFDPIDILAFGDAEHDEL
ncbi:hypothetical protein AJ79_02135 [Helicocarpus griseus UAMH5409]|uniref:Uncharacterized protein n=1 Tax=Helicocarpus griseus UAMH5409 TaxID=1447875 RepID=A0A2B7Y500_9EURO|nr:hypothetical protein AJ79_02135 [Helicocarpus griseus UAMH5409]